MLLGCIDSSKETYPVKNIQKKDEIIQIDITSEVKKYEELSTNAVNKFLEERSPDAEVLLEKLWGEKTNLYTDKSSCAKARINELNATIESKMHKRFNLFVNQIKDLKFSYDDYVRENIYKDVYQKFDLDSKFFTSKPKHELFNFDYNSLHLEDRISKFITQPQLIIQSFVKKGPINHSFILDITYHFDSYNLLGRFRREDIGKDRFHIIFDTPDDFIKVTIQNIGHESIHCIKSINEIGENIKRILLENKYIRWENKFYSPENKSNFDAKIWSKIWSFDRDLEEIIQKFEDEIPALKQKIQVISKIEDETLSCHLLAMNFKVFESQKDVSIKEIGTRDYKSKSYLTIKLIHLNILNNVNIKLNDSYKISRYLFDKIVRPGIRTFSDILNDSSFSGISFDILSSEKNFVSDDTQDLVLYQFFMPGKEIIQYINDDITGRALAEASYILVDGERIELR